MGRAEDSDTKSRLVSEIFSISTASIACSHTCRTSSSSSTTNRTSPVESHFVDWYRLLGVCFFLDLCNIVSWSIFLRRFFFLLGLQDSCYLFLQVGEDAGADVIRKRYHKLGKLIWVMKKGLLYCLVINIREWLLCIQLCSFILIRTNTPKLRLLSSLF